MLIFIFFTIILAANIALWSKTHTMQATWANVPFAPSSRSATMAALGDKQFAFRLYAMLLQNFGDVGGRTTSLKDYNYENVASWLMLEDELDPRSNLPPMLAAYYFGATPDTQDLAPVIKYLETAGQRPYDQKWRWLAQAVYLERFKHKDMKNAERLADLLAAQYKAGMPGWVLQMPAFVRMQTGDKQAAYSILINILKSDAEHLDPAEVFFMKDYICTRILDAAQAADHPLCKDVK
jgi:hypothetical protein